MRTARRVAGLVIAIAFAGAAIALVLRRSDPASAPPEEEPAAVAADPAAPPALAGRPASTTPPDEAAPAAAPSSEDRPAPPGTLVVLVVGLPEGAPVDGADVIVRLEDGNPLAASRTDASGSARFEGLAHDRVAVEARAPGRVLGATWVSDLKRPFERRITVALEPGIALTGIVLVAGTTRPVANAEVVARRGGAVEGMSVAYNGPPLMRTRSDSSGEFRVEGVPLGAVVSIDARAPGFVLATRSLMLGEGSRTHPRVEIRLAPAAVVSGRVVDPDGRPVAGAEVCAIAYDSAKGDVGVLDARLGPWGVGAGLAATATTDAEGAYLVDGLRFPAHYRLFARKAGAARSALTDPALHVEGPERLRVGDLALRRPSTLSIRVLGPAGTEIDGARVWIDLRGMDLVPEKDGLGAFRFEPVPPGTYEVLVARSPYVPAAKRVVLAEGARVEERVSLERGVSIAGVVVDDAGAPLSGAGVTAYPVAVDGDGAGGSGAATDAEGRFRIEGLRPGPHRLVASAGGHAASQPLPLSAPAADARFVLRRAGTLRLRLVLPAGATPPARVKLNVEDLDRGGGLGSEQAWQEGRIVAGDLTSSSVRVSVAVAGYAPVLRVETVAPGEVRDLGDVVLDDGVELLGRVVDGAGAPRPGARIRVLLPGLLDDAVTTAGTDGRFRIPRLPTGEGFVRIEAEGCVPGAERVTLGPKTFLTFTLVPGFSVRGVVRSASGAAASDVRVVFRLEGDAPLGVPRERSESTDDSGAFTLVVAGGSHGVVVEGSEKQVLLRLPQPVVVPREAPLALEVP